MKLIYTPKSPDNMCDFGIFFNRSELRMYWNGNRISVMFWEKR